MRLSHKQVFKNTEEGVRFCGIVVVSERTEETFQFIVRIMALGY